MSTKRRTKETNDKHSKSKKKLKIAQYECEYEQHMETWRERKKV